MKKSIIPALAAALVLTAACNDTTGRHELTIVHPSQGFNIHYADAHIDSIAFITHDSWSLTTTHPEWLQIDGPASGTINHSDEMRYLVVSHLKLTPNATQHTRQGQIAVSSYDYKALANYFQLGHLNISRPTPTIETFLPGTNMPDSVSFCLADSALAVADSICFATERSWQLVPHDPAPQWLTLHTTEGFSGRNTVHFTLQPNSSPLERTATLSLIAGPIENIITICQKGQKPEGK